MPKPTQQQQQRKCSQQLQRAGRAQEMQRDKASENGPRRIAGDIGQLHPTNPRADTRQILLHRALHKGESHTDQEGWRPHHDHGQEDHHCQRPAMQARMIHRHQISDRPMRHGEPKGCQQKCCQYKARALGDEKRRARVLQVPHHACRHRHAKPIGQQENPKHSREKIGVVLPNLANDADPENFQRHNHIARQENQKAP